MPLRALKNVPLGTGSDSVNAGKMGTGSDSVNAGKMGTGSDSVNVGKMGTGSDFAFNAPVCNQAGGEIRACPRFFLSGNQYFK